MLHPESDLKPAQLVFRAQSAQMNSVHAHLKPTMKSMALISIKNLAPSFARTVQHTRHPAIRTRRVAVALARTAALCGCMVIVGCNGQAVSVKPEAGGLMPPANPEKSESAEAQPTVVAAAAKPWLDVTKLPIESWYAIYSGGRSIGFSQIKIEPSETQGTALLRLTKRDVIESADPKTQSRRLGEFVLESLELPNGQFQSYSERILFGKEATENTAALLRETLTVSHTVDGKPATITLPWPKGAWGPMGSICMLKQHPLKANEQIEGQIFVPQIAKFAKVVMTSGEFEWTPMPGAGTAELLPIESRWENDKQSVVIKNWVDRDGTLMKSVGADGFTMFKVPREEAIRIEGELRVAQWISTRMPVAIAEEQLQNPSVTFTVDSSEIDPFFALSSKTNQQLTSLSALGAEATVYRVTAEEKAPEAIAQDAPTSEHATPIDADSPTVKKFLTGLTANVPSEASPLEAAKQLTEIVFLKFKKELPTSNFLRPAETLSKQSGDSKAHAVVLLTALRNRGISSRVASGVRLVKADNQIVAMYHMWCEAWIDDRWLPLDPFAGTIGIGGDHIKFLESSLATDDWNNAVLPVLQSMNKLTIAAKP